MITFQCDNVQVEVPIPRRSLYCMRGEARYLWQHGIKQEHIKAERIVVTFREIEKSFGDNEARDQIIEIA